ncbi:MAG: thioredoxin domain-containing protein [Gemmatimonadaceae bacterium]|nr:thioredoxin domain-containing protein [Gemmatimonadaceae bacterium]
MVALVCAVASAALGQGKGNDVARIEARPVVLADGANRPLERFGTLPTRATWDAQVRTSWRDSLLAFTRFADSVRRLAPGTVPQTGLADAPLLVEAFEDFQCPYCAAQESRSKAALREYERRGLVRTVHYDLPIPGHRNAWDASVFSLCAEPHGAYETLRPLLFESQSRWAEAEDPRPVFRELARRTGASADSIMACYETGTPLPIAQYGVAQAMKRRVNATPTFIIAGRVVVGGSGNAASFAVLLEDALLGRGSKPAYAPAWKRAVAPDR